MPDKNYDYLVTLKKDVDKKINVISIILLFIAMCVFSYVGTRLYTIAFKYALVPYSITAVIFAWIIYCNTSKKPIYYRFALLLAGAYFLFSPLDFKWVGFLYILAGLFEKQAKFSQEIGIDKFGITINSFPLKNYAWNELNNVVIKDNLLTIDFKPNKIFQKEIQDTVSKDMENEFNTYCANQLNALENK